MPVYTLPTFNLIARAWQPGLNPLVDPQTYPDFMCQLYTNSRAQGQYFAEYIIRKAVLHGTSFFPGFLIQIDLVTLTMPSSYFKVESTALVHYGFPNQYWAFSCSMCLPDGTPLDVVA